MSIFKTHWIILKIKKIDEKKLLYTIFTKQFWKILYNKKYSQKEKSLDIGYAIQFETRVQQWVNIHSIHNIHITQEFNSIWVWFNRINNFLMLISYVDTHFPLDLQHEEIYETLLQLLQFQNTPQVKNVSLKIILIILKIQTLSGSFECHHSDTTIQKILNFIQKNKASNILRLSWITEKYETLLTDIALRKESCNI